MRTLDRVEIRKGKIYDFLPSIYRLVNNERLIAHFKELTPDYRPTGEIRDWANATVKNLPETVFEKMKVYFDWRTPLAMRLSSLISEKDLSTPEEFFQELERLSPRDILRDFLLIGLGPRSTGFDERMMEDLLQDQQKALVFLAEKVVLTPLQKTVMLDFFSSPELMKEDFGYLLRWYGEHIFPSVPYDGAEVARSEISLIKNLERKGEEYLLKLIDNMHYEELEERRKIILSISYFVENAQAGIFHPQAANDLFIVGYRLVNSALEEDPLRLACTRFRALGKENSLKLLKVLLDRRYTGYELSRKLKMSNAELTEAFSALLACGLVKTYRTSEGVYFAAEREEVIGMLSEEFKG